IDAALAVRAEDRPQNIAALRAILRGGGEGRPGTAAGAPVAAEPGATLIAGESERGDAPLVPMEPGATLVSDNDARRSAPDEARRPAPSSPPAAPRAKGRGRREILHNARPEHLAIVAGTLFFALIGVLVLLVVLLARR